MTIERAKGIRVPLVVNTAPLRDAEGNVITAVVAFDDITERKQAEQQVIRQMEELRILNDDLIRFNKSFVSREFRMIELKKEINELCVQCGQQPRYPLEFEK
jgi:hypothetical protein